MKNFGKNLLLLRKQRKLSQAALGTLIDISGDMLGRYERSNVTPSIEVVAKMADVLGVSIDYVMGKSSFLYDKKIVQRMEAIATLTKANKAFVFQLIDMTLRDIAAQEAYAE